MRVRCKALLCATRHFVIHAYGIRRCLSETKPGIQFLSSPVSEQAHVSAFRNMFMDVFHDLRHDEFAKPPALVRRQHRDINNLIEATAVPNNTTHADRITRKEDLNSEQGVRKRL